MEEKSIRVLLMDEIADDLEALSHFSPDTEEYQKVADNIGKLHKLLMDEEAHSLESESQLYDDRRKDDAQKKDHVLQWFKIGVEVCGVVLPLVAYSVWYNKGLKFEETGTITSSMVRGLMNRFRPAK